MFSYPAFFFHSLSFSPDYHDSLFWKLFDPFHFKILGNFPTDGHEVCPIVSSVLSHLNGKGFNMDRKKNW